MGVIRVLESAPPGTAGDGSSRLRLHVIYTTPDATRDALGVACQLARDLHAEINLLAANVVPYPRSIQDPATSAAFTEALLARLARECKMDVAVDVLLCRDREETILRWLPHGCIAIIGKPGRWWPGSWRRLVRAVKRVTPNALVIDAGRSKALFAHSTVRQTKL